jgi:type I restriction-modification system DNA methylase subunit/restriction endonuclease S subunit
MEVITKIKSKEEVNKLYECIHNLLWSDEGLSPEQFNEKLNFFFFLKAIEPQIECKNLVFCDHETSQKCRFSYLAQIENEHELYDIFANVVIPQIYKHPDTKEYFKAVKVSRSRNLFLVIQEINRIDINSQDFDFLGDLYEYCIGRGTSQMSDDGQYYTNRPICNLIVRHLNPVVDVDSRNRMEIPSMIDPFSGTGGMNITYVNHINQQMVNKDDPERYSKIKEIWQKNRKSIYGSDISALNVMSTKMNLLFHTGVTFTKDTLRQANSFKETLFLDDGNKPKKYKYIMTNSPFGGDKSKGKDYRFKYGQYENGKKSGNYIYEVSPEIQKIDIRVDDKVPTAVQLCMASLEEDGGCGMVLPEGFFFSSVSHFVKTRQHLIENFKVSKVIDIPQGAFENTPTKTSIIIFYNPSDPTQRTKEIEFISFDRPNSSSKKNIPFDQYIEVSNGKVGIDAIRKNKYILKYNKYTKTSSGINEFILSDLVTLTKGKFKSKEACPTGQYDFYTGKANNPNGKIDQKDCSGESIIMTTNGGSGIGKYGNHIGLGSVYYTIDSIGVTSTNVILKKKSDHVNMKYLYYILKNRKNEIMDLANYTTGLGHITLDEIANLIIQLPSMYKQLEYLQRIDSMDISNAMKTVEKCLETEIIQDVYNSCHMFPITSKKFSDILTFEKKSEHLASTGNLKGKYRFYCSSQQKLTFTDHFDFEELRIIIGTGGKPSIHLDDHFSSSTDTFVLYSKTEYLPFLYYYFLAHKYIIDNGFDGTTLGHISKSYLLNLELVIPDISVQKSIQSKFEYLQHTRNMIKQIEQQKETQMLELFSNQGKQEISDLEVAEPQVSEPKVTEQQSTEQLTEPVTDPVTEYITDGQTTSESNSREPSPIRDHYTKQELIAKSLKDLRLIAKRRNVKGISKFKSTEKDKLADLILEKQ